MVTEVNVSTRGNRKIVQGVVTSDKMDKTISVKISYLTQHPLYKKYIKRHTVYKAHDEQNTAKSGDLVEIQETRPLSKTKRWRLVRVVKAAVIH